MAMRFAGAAILLLAAGCDTADDAGVGEDGAVPTSLPELADAGEGDTGATTKAPSAAGEEQTSPDVAALKVKVACVDGEETVFSCKTTSGNDLAVCAGGESVHYRFGKGSPSMSLMGAEWASVAYSGGGEAQIRFANGNTNYIVFSRIVRTNFKPGEPNNPAISDGVIVTRGEEVLGMHTCLDDGSTDPINYDLADANIKPADDLFTFETGRAD